MVTYILILNILGRSSDHILITNNKEKENILYLKIYVDERKKKMYLDNQPILQKLYSIAVWISRLAIVNILWILFTIAGLVIFGIGPSTIAMSIIINRWINKDESFPIFSVFIKAYKKHFMSANFISLIMIIIGYVVVFNFNFTRVHNLSYVYISLAGAIGIIYFLMAITIFPLYANNATNISELFKTNLLFIVSYPLNTLILFLATTGLIIIQLFMPGLIFFFSGSTIVFVATLRVHRAIDKTSRIQQMEIIDQ